MAQLGKNKGFLAMSNNEHIREEIRRGLSQYWTDYNDADTARRDATEKFVDRIAALVDKAVADAMAQRDKECAGAGHIILEGEAAKKFKAILDSPGPIHRTEVNPKSHTYMANLKGEQDGRV